MEYMLDLIQGPALSSPLINSLQHKFKGWLTLCFKTSVKIEVEFFICLLQCWVLHSTSTVLFKKKLYQGTYFLWFTQIFCRMHFSRGGFPGSSMVTNLLAKQDMQEMRVRSLSWKDPQKKEMATHSSILA